MYCWSQVRPSRVDWNVIHRPSALKYASAFSPPKVSWRRLLRCRFAGIRRQCTVIGTGRNGGGVEGGVAGGGSSRRPGKEHGCRTAETGVEVRIVAAAYRDPRCSAIRDRYGILKFRPRSCAALFGPLRGLLRVFAAAAKISSCVVLLRSNAMARCSCVSSSASGDAHRGIAEAPRGHARFDDRRRPSATPASHGPVDLHVSARRAGEDLVTPRRSSRRNPTAPCPSARRRTRTATLRYSPPLGEMARARASSCC